MDTITYENIQIQGIPFHKIGKLQIRHRVNDHGYCHIEGEMTAEQARDILQRVDERFALKIETKAAGQPSVLFYGMGYFCLDSVFYDLLDGFPEDIGVPDSLVAVFRVLFDVGDEIFRLLLASDYGGDLRLDVVWNLHKKCLNKLLGG